jgi:zinc D-Ala-D-Ala carboxypeptidase
MRLSKNFTLSEMTKSQSAERLDIDNTPDQHVIENLKFLCERVLQPLRDIAGPLIISSGYRSHALNKAIGGSQTSQHVLGLAADIESPTMGNEDLARLIANKIPIFDQLILEYHTQGQPSSGWVHVSINSSGVNRRETLIINKQGKRTWKP